MRRSVWTGLVAGAMALALVAVACGGEEEGAAPQAPAATAGGGAPAAGGGYGRGAPQTPAPGQSVLTVGQDNFFFDPAQFTVAAGATITVQNLNSGTPHTFTIPDRGIDLVNDPGQTQTVAIDIQPGTYRFVCRFHESAGMVGTITVTG